MMRARAAVLAFSATAIGGLLTLRLIRPETNVVVAQQDVRVPLIVELDTPSELLTTVEWPAPATRAADLAPFRPSSVISRLQDRLPSLDSFVKVGQALPLLRVESRTAPRRVSFPTFFVCGTALAADVTSIAKKSKHVYPNLPISLGERSRRQAKAGPCSSVADCLGVDKLPTRGQGVLAAIVGDGFNSSEHPKRAAPSRCGTSVRWPCFDQQFSHSVIPNIKGGSVGSVFEGHSAMVAFDTTIAAPDVTWADEVTAQHLCDAATIYVDLALDILERGLLTEGTESRDRYRGLVVINSWSVADPWSDPLATDYVDNPNHPTSVMAGTLAGLGADVVFAAGNCGPSPKPGCNGHTKRAIYGANSHPDVLTVAAVGWDGSPAGYSARGSGHLSLQKPDIGAYSDFEGSGAYGPDDSGTSAAAPVAAGVLAALRSSRPFDPWVPDTSPEKLRAWLLSLAEPCAPNRYGYPNYKVGWGIVGSRCM